MLRGRSWWWGRHRGGAQDAVLERVAGLHDERDRGGLDVVGVLVHERLVEVRVELLADRAEARQAVGAEDLLELQRDRVEGRALGDVAVLAPQFHVVEYRDQGGQDTARGRLLGRLGRGLDPTTRVDVLRLLALELLAELDDPALELGDPSGIGRGGARRVRARGGLLEELRRLGVDRVGRLLAAGDLGGGGVPGGTDGAVLRVHLPLVGEGEPRLALRALRVVGVARVLGHHFFSSSSSTISASTTSSSSDDGASALSGAPSAPSWAWE